MVVVACKISQEMMLAQLYSDKNLQPAVKS